MSFQAVAQAIVTDTPSTASKIVLVVLAHHRNHRNGRCYPTQATIAAESHLDVRTVRRAVAELEAAGLISKRYVGRAGTVKKCIQYRLEFLAQARLALKRQAPDRESAKQGTSPPSVRTSGEESLPHKPKKRSQKAKPKMRIDPEWKPSEKEAAYAAERGFDPPQIEDMAEHFRLYWLTRGSVYADWRSAWYMWVRNAVRFREADNAKAGSPGPRSRGQRRQDDLRDMHEIAAGLSAKWAERDARGGDDLP